MSVKFNIVNFTKRSSQYESFSATGMRICIFSNRENKLHNVGWIKGGYDFKYQRSRINKPVIDGQTQKVYFELSFKYDFKAVQDKVYFAYSVPFTYS